MNDHVWVEIEPEASPISGVVHSRDGRDDRFTGWLELVGLLEAALEAPSARTHNPVTGEELR